MLKGSYTVQEAINYLQSYRSEAICTVDINVIEHDSAPKTFQLKTGEIVKLDEVDFRRECLFSWKRKKAASGFYCARQIYRGYKHKTLYLHREVIIAMYGEEQLLERFPEGWEGHHKNGDRFDCTRENLEPVKKHHGKGKK